MKIKSYSTYYDNKNVKQRDEKIIQFVKDDERENQLLNLYPEVKYQELEGFGGAVTDSAGYIYSLMNEEQKREMIKSYFGSDRMGYNLVRIPIDSCDFSLEHYEACSDEADENFNTFSLKRVEKYVLPLLDDIVKEYGQGLEIMLSPWSPPAYMKTNKERNNGGQLLEEYKERWAKYICRYIREFKNRGYNITKLTLQNEPKAVQTWDSCVYTAQEQKEFLVNYMWPELKSNQLQDIEIYIWDHNKERAYEWAETIIDESTTHMIAGIAFHWYSGDHFETLQMIKERFPDKKLLLSEACIEYSKFDASDFLCNAQKYAHDMIGNFNQGMNTFIDWNLILDEIGGPNHVGNFCDAPYLYDRKNKELLEKNILDYVWHFSHFIKPGAMRIGVSRFTDKVEMVAFKKEDTITVILLNRTAEDIEAHLRISDNCAPVVVQANSIMSCEIMM